jgi:tetratricopeptide (TPR) repeat protein
MTILGREQDLELVELLLRHAPIVAVVGPGGVGKTALVEECARRRRAEGGQVVVVALERLGSDVDPRSLEDDLQLSRGALVIIDGAEILPPAARAVLGRIARVRRLLVASRAPLGLGEAVVPLGGLGREAAIELVLRRARSSADPARDRVRAEAIVDRVGTAPLALEIAAAGLDDPGSDDRDRSIAVRGSDVIAELVSSSWSRLGLDERRALAVLALLGRSLDLGLAALVFDELAIGPEVLERLVAAAMAHIDGGRIRIHELIADHARASTDVAALGDELVAPVARWVGSKLDDAGHPRSPRDHAALCEERRAIDHAFALSPPSAELRAPLSLGLLVERGDYAPGAVEIADRALSAGLEGELRAVLLARRARAYAFTARSARGIADVEAGHASIAELDGPVAAQIRAELEVARVWSLLWEGDYAAASAAAERGIAWADEAGDERSLGRMYMYRAWASNYLGQSEVALDDVRRAREILERAGDRRGTANVHYACGSILHDRGELASAAASYRLAFFELAGMRARFATNALIGIGACLHESGALGRAARLLRGAARRAKRTADLLDESLARFHASMLAIEEGDPGARGELDAAIGGGLPKYVLPLAFAVRGAIARRAGDLPAAEAAFTEAARVSPRDPTLHAALTQIESGQVEGDPSRFARAEIRIALRAAR